MTTEVSPTDRVYAIDFETYYDKEISVKLQGSTQYTKKTDISLVAIVGNDGFTWVGDPLDAPWGAVMGPGVTWVSHNRTFDKACWLALEPFDEWGPEEWHCTADLCSFIGAPIRLADASQVLFGHALDKNVRKVAKGKQWLDYDPQARKAMENYAIADASYCLLIWTKFAEVWPDFERNLSLHTTLMCHRGIGIDEEMLKESRQKLFNRLEELRDIIPWGRDVDKKGRPVTLLSPLKLGALCEQEGISPPTTRAAKSELYAQWKARNEGTLSVKTSEAMSEYQSIGRTLEVVKKMENYSENGRFYYDFLYHGAHTGRWAGSGVNIQNLTKRTVAGVDLRHHLIPSPGYEFLIIDYSQIEAILTLWAAGETRILSLVADGMDLYEAHGRVCGMYSDPRPMKEADPKLRDLCKARVLALGYGVEWKKFIIMAWDYARVVLSGFEAKKNVKEFRKNSPEIVSLWNRLEKEFDAHHLTDWHLELPSERVLHYYDCRHKGDYRRSAKYVLGEHDNNIHKGLLCENYIQAIGRDILAVAILRLEGCGFPVVMHVHDEVVLEVPQGKGEELLPEAVEIMTSTNGWLEWADGLPLRAEGHVMNYYTKL